MGRTQRIANMAKIDVKVYRNNKYYSTIEFDIKKLCDIIEKFSPKLKEEEYDIHFPSVIRINYWEE